MSKSVKVLIRGGSIAAGYGVNKSYPDILQENLAKLDIEIINRSRYRETTFDGIATFETDIEAVKPDILLFHFGIDDAFQCVYRSEFQENMVQMIRLARTRFDPSIILATSQGFDNPHDNNAVNIFYRSLKVVSRDLHCPLIPVDDYCAQYCADNDLRLSDLVQSDSRYLNDTGHRVIAEYMTKCLLILIKSPGNN